MGETINALMEASRAVGFSIAKSRFRELLDRYDRMEPEQSVTNSLRLALSELEYTPSPATQEDK
jgi:hypothetical protein